jgi:hypothetical protein
MCVENKYVGEVKELWHKAFKQTLTEQETKVYLQIYLSKP